MPRQTQRGPCFIYVIRREDGARKIGYSEFPERRLEQLRARYAQAMVLEANWLAERHRAAERIIHDILRDHAIGDEWFTVSLDAALKAFEEANALALIGNDGKKLPDSPINVRVPHDLALRARLYAVRNRMKLKDVVAYALRLELAAAAAAENDPS